MLYGRKMLVMVNIVHIEAYMKVLSGKERGALILAGRRKEEEKASARKCAILGRVKLHFGDTNMLQVNT